MNALSLIYNLSYPGFFILGLISTAIPFYSPPLYLSLPFILYKTHLNTFLAIILTALGMTTGQLTSYYIGYTGEKLLDKKLENNKIYKKFLDILEKYGLLILPVTAAIPFPIFDIIAISYGLAREDVKTFFILVFIGKLIKTSYVTIIGLYILTHLHLIKYYYAHICYICRTRIGR